METDAALEVSRQLGREERLVWTGQPYQGLLFTAFDLFPTLFGIVWSGGFIAMIFATSPGPPTPIVALFLVPGLYMAFGRLPLDAYLRTRIFYGVTNERVIIISGVFQKTIRSLDLRTLSDISLTERALGRGTIEFGRSDVPWYLTAMDWWTPGLSGRRLFERIGNCKEVFDQIRAAQRAAQQRDVSRPLELTPS